MPDGFSPIGCWLAWHLHFGPNAGGDAATVDRAVGSGGAYVLTPKPERLAMVARKRGAGARIVGRGLVAITPRAAKRAKKQDTA